MEFRLKERREEKKMTQVELAEKSGVSRAIISGLESGRVTTTSTDTLMKLAHALGIKVSSIFFDSNV